MLKKKICVAVEVIRLIKVDDYLHRLNKKLEKSGKKKIDRSEFLIESAELRIESEKRKRRVK